MKVLPKFLDPIQWEEITGLINWLYNDFTKRLTKEIPQLTESDIQICCLLKLRLGIQEIATLLGISPASVSKRKHRVKERIIQQTKNSFDENQALDLWVWEY